jgi:hypothetical protein
MKDTREEENSLSLLPSEYSVQQRLKHVVQVRISSIGLVRVLILIIIGLLCFSTVGQISKYILDRARLLGLVRLFWIDEEGNIPALYAAKSLLICSLLLAAIAMVKKQKRDQFEGTFFRPEKPGDVLASVVVRQE